MKNIGWGNNEKTKNEFKSKINKKGSHHPVPRTDIYRLKE